MNNKTCAGENEQYLPPDLITGEKKLIMSMIERAFLDLRQPDMHVRKSARMWFLSKATQRWSFFWCLHIIEKEAWIRDILSRVHEEIENFEKKKCLEQEAETKEAEVSESSQSSLAHMDLPPEEPLNGVGKVATPPTWFVTNFRAIISR